ncbi:MAG TPA: type II toxin-antitoxin system VapC family toxin [Phycisphaerales bacterium]|nr:type II toxin-antitoxin system VapC family toxin [Phycisphaerales bacterium]
MLDTCTCIDLLRAGSEMIASRAQTFALDEIALSSVTLAELWRGVFRSARRQHHEALLVRFCTPLAVVPFDSSAAEVYGRLRGTLERAGTPIGALDTLIASHAIAVGATLITSNEREFRRVPGLKIENWARG